MQSKTLIIPGAIATIIIVLVLGNMGLLPATVVNLWPIILIIAGLFGLTSYDVEKATAIPNTISTKPKPSSIAKNARKKKVAPDKSGPQKKSKKTVRVHKSSKSRK